ncbi:ABC transporter ATP-binding protein [Salinigranum halophilum]|jgi:ABC-type Fe3+/spermidine/putrescine transport system ATPase subunit|uniref:ABC transporter ATP-binding protein n=1 Tax=Salinigranum halophilum TaxID=2565931 RepID=UPI0010A80366|nr:ABC transporter ATP-binding protein [Salinigranum halophilum]
MSVAREVERIISVTSLEKSFSNEQVLRGIDFSVEDGEFCVVVGPSGSGKSTLLKCIAGLVEFDRGSISLGGRDVGELSVPDRDLGFVFQDFEERLFPHMTVAENVAFGLRQAGVSEAEIETKTDDMLELLAISETRDSLPAELSGGQQQRVELARQLVRECDVMLLDDPLADLDYKLQKRMELEMRQIHEELGSTFVYVTHNQDQALKLADKLVVVNQGLIEQVGTPDEVYAEPATAFVGRFVGDSNPLLGTVTAVDGDTLTVETPVGSVVAATRDDGVEPGAEVVVLVRPESVRLGDAADGCDNTFAGDVAGRTYTGEVTEFTVSLDTRGETDVEDFQSVTSGNVPMETVQSRTSVGWNADEGVAYAKLSVSDTATVDDLMEV